MNILIDDKVSCRIEGEGPTIVLLHSLLAGSSSFDRIVPDLAKSFRVVVPDLPGFGLSLPVEGGLIGAAESLENAIRKIVTDQKPIVLGNGYGGFVVLQIAIRHPDLARRLIFADCGAKFSEAGREAFRNMAKGAAAKGFEAIADVAMRRLFAPGFQDANPELMQQRRAAFLTTNPVVFQTACADLAALDLTGELKKVQAPALVMVGEQDEATPVEMSVALADGLADARLEILPGCAHVPQLQAPEKFLATLLPFIEAAHVR
jgi:3-oxoadipate enol-lactonase